jgi:hypothetical protein
MVLVLRYRTRVSESVTKHYYNALLYKNFHTDCNYLCLIHPRQFGAKFNIIGLDS